MSNYTNATKNLEQIVDQLNTNNHGAGFDSHDTWSIEQLIQVTQIQATLAVHDAVTAPTRKAGAVTASIVYAMDVDEAIKRFGKEEA